jgi:hypothetical protein
MRNDILLIGLIPLISAIPQLSYKYTATHREENGLLSNFTSNPEQEEVSSHQSNAKTNAVMADNQIANQIASLQTPSGAGVIPSQATTELQMKMQKAFQDFANTVAQIASEAQIQASQLTVNPNAFAPPAIAAIPTTPQQTPQAEAQPQPQPQPQSQPDTNSQPSNEPNPQPSQEEAPQTESEAPASPPAEENSEQPSPAGSTRSLLDDLMASTDDSGSEVSSSDNYQFQFQSSPLPAYNPVYVKYDYPSAYDISSVPAYGYYTTAYPAAYSVASYNGYADPSTHHNLARSKPATDSLQAASSSSSTSSSSVNHSQKLTSSSIKPRPKELPDASIIHSSQETKSSESSSSSSSPHQQQKLSASSTKPKPEAMPAKPATSQKNSLQASSIHPKQASPLVQESQFKAAIVSEQPSTIPSQSPSTASSSPSQLDKVLTQIETEAAPMLKRRERFNNMADHRVVIKDKFSEAQQQQKMQMRKTRKQRKLL